MRHFFTKEKKLELKKDNHVQIGGANDALKAKLQFLYDGLFRNNYDKWGMGLLLTFVAVVMALTGIGIQFSEKDSGIARNKIEGILAGALNSDRLTHTM